MPRELKCPVCGNTGGATTDGQSAFEVRGQFQGKAVRRCNECGAGLAIGLMSGGLFGRPRVIPDELWQRMQASWNRAFGNK